MNHSNVYRVYLLRLWQEGDTSLIEPAPLRILLEDPHNGERHSFADFASLADFLASQLEQKRNE